MAFLRMRQEGTMIDRISSWNNNNGSLFWNPYDQRQFSAKHLKDFGEDHSGNLAYLCRNELIQVKEHLTVKVDLLMKVIYENTIAWYTCIEIMNCQIVLVIVYITVMKMPAVEKESLENIPDSEKIRSSVMDEEEVPEQQHSLVSVEDLKARDTKGGQRFLLQPSDIQSHTMKVSIQHNPTRKFLEWFDGGGNTPFHISGKLLEVFTALSNFVPYCSSVIRKCLSTKTKDLNIFTYFTLYWLRMYTITHDLLKLKCSKEKKLCSRKAGLTLVDTNKKDCIFEEQLSDQKSNMMEQKRHSKGRGRVGVMYSNRSKAVHRTKALMSGARFLSCFKISKNGLGVLILLLVFPALTAGSPVKDKDKRSDLEMLNRYFPLLTSGWCTNPEIKYKCPDSDSVMNDKAQLCEYACKTHENLICLNSDEGAVYFCISKSTRCGPGIGWQVEHTTSGMVVINEIFCPQGFYQTKESKCFNACTAEHFQLRLIPEMFTVYRKGDHTHPTILVCDYMAGFYNAHNMSFVNYDDSFIVNQDFCTHVNDSDPCAHGQMPLYNGTCVDNCSLGYLRDEHDYLCKQLDENSVVHIKTSTLAPVSTQSSAEVLNLTTQIGNSDENSEKSNALAWYMYILVIVGPLLLFAFILFYVVKVRGRQNDPSQTYQMANLNECAARCTSSGSSSNSLARNSVESDDIVEDSSTDTEETTEKKIAPSSDILNGRISVESDNIVKDSSIDTEETTEKKIAQSPDLLNAGKDDESDNTSTDSEETTEKKIALSSQPLNGTTARKTVKKKTKYSRNIMIKIGKVNTINFGRKDVRLNQVKLNGHDADLGITEGIETDTYDSEDTCKETDDSRNDLTFADEADDLYV